MRESLEHARACLDEFVRDESGVARLGTVAGAIAEALMNGGKVLACGNGGSACDAMHFCEELTGRFRQDRPPLAAIACVDPGHLTCTANDYGFDFVFSRWVEALGGEKDVLVVLSTSGNSANVVNAAEAASAIGMTTVALLGKGGGTLRGLCDHEWVVPGETSDRIQELHMMILHLLVQGVEERMFGES